MAYGSRGFLLLVNGGFSTLKSCCVVLCVLLIVVAFGIWERLSCWFIPLRLWISSQQVVSEPWFDLCNDGDEHI